MTDETRKDQEAKDELTDKDLGAASGGYIIHRPSTRQNEESEKRRD